jgi:hypothetical protein
VPRGYSARGYSAIHRVPLSEAPITRDITPEKSSLHVLQGYILGRWLDRSQMTLRYPVGALVEGSDLIILAVVYLLLTFKRKPTSPELPFPGNFCDNLSH